MTSASPKELIGCDNIRAARAVLSATAWSMRWNSAVSRTCSTALPGAAAAPRDELWHLISRVPSEDRGQVVDVLSKHRAAAGIDCARATR
jgi:hypothetical protein